ncbi:sensor histidine kinase [Alicyclobacillus fodiniaquatilis]|uniref:histidine kinase n=1 Tax=Alicyclobacillus fodiniaquatilis TaxID=1661150 RepID=A0ABW4JJN0_9BACL
MRTIRIRTFLIWALLLISTLPWITFVVVHLLLTKQLAFATNQPQTQVQAHDVMRMAPFNAWQIFAIILGFGLAVFIVGIAMRRFIIKPLEAMRRAAGQIAVGDLDVVLSKSRVLEIAEVSNGFESMVVGLQNAFQKQTVLEEERTFVINAVAHDLRTPIFALRGYLDGLEKGIAHTPEKMAMYVAVCKESAGQLDHLVTDLFTFTQMAYTEADGFAIQSELVDIKDVVMQSVDGLRVLATEKEISLLVDVHSGNFYIHGDRHLLARAMNNLIDNAVRHTPQKGDIRVQCSRSPGKVRIVVRDSGAGFSIEDIPHVFEPLYRGEDSRNRSTGGAGLGLAIAQRIIRRHGGDVAAENHADGGAIVTFWLPDITDGLPLTIQPSVGDWID